MISALILISGLLRQPPAADSARISGERLVVEPIGVSFEIPEGWLTRKVTSAGATCDLKSAQARSVTIDKEGLRSLTGSSANYGDRYYAEMADSVFAVNDLVAHLGARGWRDCDNSAADLQMRVYVSDAQPEAIARRLHSVRLSPLRSHSMMELYAPEDSSGWHIGAVDWKIHGGDYIYFERFQIYSRRMGTRTLSLVFMYMPTLDNPKVFPYPQRFMDKEGILRSVRETS